MTNNINRSLGLFATLLGNISATTCGVDAKRTVAIQCRGGGSTGVFFVFDGPIEPGDRYDGMRLAFGENAEIFKPNRQGDLSHEALDATTRNQLLVSVERRHAARNNPVLHGLVSNDALRYHRERPIWDWAMEQRYGWPLSLGYGAFALAPLFVLTVVKIWTKQNLIPEFIYGVLFLLVKFYCRKMLDVQRDICYIMIAENELEATERSRWQTLRQRALDRAPVDGQEAVADIVFGRIRVVQQGGIEYLLAPVMSLMPTLSFDAAQWWFIFRRFRGPLLTGSYIFAADSDHRWSIASAISAFIQASLQDDCARVFLATTQTYHVNWFRRMEGQNYPEEYGGYRRALM